MKRYLRYIITAAAGAVVITIILLVGGTFSETSQTAVYRDLCDAFFVVGVLMAGMGVLIFCTNGGAFDMLSFGFIKLFDLFRRDVTKAKYRTFYDYRESKKDRNRSFDYLLVVGIVFIAVGVVFYFFYIKSQPDETQTANILRVFWLFR